MSVPARFLHVTVKWGGTPNTKEIQKVIDTSLDWAKYAPNCWVLWSTREVREWLGYIKPHLSSNDSVFVFEINLSEPGRTYAGLWDKWFWDWVQRKR